MPLSLCSNISNGFSPAQIVPESSASYDGFKVQTNSIYANHMDMVKFSKSGERGYQRILGYIIEFSNVGETPAEGKQNFMHCRCYSC